MTERLRTLRARLWIVGVPVLIGILVIVLAGFVVIHFQEQATHDELSDQISQKGRLVEAFERREDEYEADLAQAKADLQAARGVFPTELTEIDVYRAISSLALDASVDFVLSPGPEGKKKLEGIDYKTREFSMTVDGGYYEVVSFVTTLDTQQAMLGTLVVDSMSVKIEEDGATATLDFIVYILA